MKRARWIPVLVAGGLLSSCGEGLAPPTTGSIALVIQFEQLQEHAAAPDLASVGEGPAAPSLGVASYTSARASADGPTPKSVDLALVDGFWEGTLADLNVGTYTVTVEGFENGALAARGVRGGVGVTAGSQTSASVTLASFVPGVNIGIGSPTTSLELPVSVTTVQGADGFRLQWANNPGFSGAASRDITTTSAVLSVSALGTYYVRARALMGSTAGAAGDSAAVDVVGDVPATGGDAGSAPNLGFGIAVNQRLTQLNIVPATDADWFSLGACTGDTLVVETFAARLSAPASNLNTHLRVFNADGSTMLAENDDLDGTTTDSRVQHVLAADGQYTVQVTSAPPGSVGRYEVDLQVRPGGTNPGGFCQFVSNVVVTPPSANLAPGATQQLAAAAFDSAGTAMSGIRFLWISSNTNVAVVDTTGRVTAMGGGSATVSAVGQGEPGNSVINVSGPPLGAPTQVAFSVQPTTAVAGEAFSPAIDIEIRDGNGNLVTDARNTVTLTIANNPGGASLYGTKTVSANGGVARFTGLFMDKAAAGYTLTATATSLTNATSTAFTVNPGPPSRLTFGGQPTDAEGRTAIAPAVTATISDAFGNTVTGATNAVTMDFGVNVWYSVLSGGGSTLSGTKTVNAVAGVATFSDLTVDKPGPGYSLRATAAGLNDAESDPFGVTLTVQSVRAARMGYHTCAVADGGPYCWGAGWSGQLGNGMDGYDSVPGPVAGGLVFTQMVGGDSHSCGLTAAGQAYCWGYNYYGQLGDNSTTETNTPVAVSGGLTFSSLGSGAIHTCGVTTGNALYCWGYNGYGQLGDNTTTNAQVPTLVAGGLSWATVSPGYYHTCGITTSGDAYCWGYDGNGQLGDDVSYVNKGTPVVVAGSKTWAAISGAYYHTCGVDAAGAGFCWGYNQRRLGADTIAYPINVTQPTPVPVFGGLAFSKIEGGWDHTCGLTTGGDAYCWGYNWDGMLGNGTTTDSPVRVLVSGGHTFTSLTVGGYHSCARKASNEVWCWGYGYDGQLGHGARGRRTEPVQIVQ